VKSQGIADAVRGMRFGIHPPRLKLGPIAAIPREDLSVEVQQTDERFILPGRSFSFMIKSSYHQMIIIAIIFIQAS
jgi:hypothetical protein